MLKKFVVALSALTLSLSAGAALACGDDACGGESCALEAKDKAHGEHVDAEALLVADHAEGPGAVIHLPLTLDARIGPRVTDKNVCPPRRLVFVRGMRFFELPSVSPCLRGDLWSQFLKVVTSRGSAASKGVKGTHTMNSSKTAPLHLTETDFDQTISSTTKPVLVDFWAEWCGPCHAIAPALEELATELNGKVTIAKLNIDENPKTAIKYGVRSIPTLIMFKNGEPMAMQVGAAPKSRLSDWIKKAI